MASTQFSERSGLSTGSASNPLRRTTRPTVDERNEKRTRILFFVMMGLMGVALLYFAMLPFFF